MKRNLLFSLAPFLLCLLLTAGCSTTNLSKVLHELKSDPATVKFSVMAPGWAVTFERAWPTNITAEPTARSGLPAGWKGSTLHYPPK